MYIDQLKKDIATIKDSLSSAYPISFPINSNDIQSIIDDKSEQPSTLTPEQMAKLVGYLIEAIENASKEYTMVGGLPKFGATLKTNKLLGTVGKLIKAHAELDQSYKNETNRKILNAAASAIGALLASFGWLEKEVYKKKVNKQEAPDFQSTQDLITTKLAIAEELPQENPEEEENKSVASDDAGPISDAASASEEIPDKEVELEESIASSDTASVSDGASASTEASFYRESIETIVDRVEKLTAEAKRVNSPFGEKSPNKEFDQDWKKDEAVSKTHFTQTIEKINTKYNTGPYKVLSETTQEITTTEIIALRNAETKKLSASSRKESIKRHEDNIKQCNKLIELIEQKLYRDFILTKKATSEVDLIDRMHNDLKSAKTPDEKREKIDQIEEITRKLELPQNAKYQALQTELTQARLAIQPPQKGQNNQATIEAPLLKTISDCINRLTEYSAEDRSERITFTYEWWKGNKTSDFRSSIFGLKRNIFIVELNTAINEYLNAGDDNDKLSALEKVQTLAKEGQDNYRAVVSKSSKLCTILKGLENASDMESKRIKEVNDAVKKHRGNY